MQERGPDFGCKFWSCVHIELFQGMRVDAVTSGGVSAGKEKRLSEAPGSNVERSGVQPAKTTVRRGQSLEEFQEDVICLEAKLKKRGNK